MPVSNEIYCRDLSICRNCEHFYWTVQMFVWTRCLMEDGPNLPPSMYENTPPPEGCPFFVEHDIFELNEKNEKPENV